jgi:hypothetical protein
MLDSLLLGLGRLLSVFNTYWYVTVPAALALLAVLLVRLKLWPQPSARTYLRGLAVDVAEQHDLIVLIHAARQDPQFRSDVRQLLDLEPERRRAFLDKRIKGMLDSGAPPSFIEAVGLLRDEQVVIRVRHLLEQAEREK